MTTPETNATTPPPLPPRNPAVDLLETLLKNPARIIHDLHDGRGSAPLIWPPIIALVCLSIYGLVAGTLSGGDQLWIAPLKITVGTFFAAFICLPSLYVFACLSGADINLRTTFGTIFAAIGLSSLLLIGFAPVVWIFSQSTDSLAFMGGLHLLLWAISIYFGLGILRLMSSTLGLRGPGHLRVWSAIFIIVSLQMMTTLRPIIGQADTLLPQQKKFFITHWLETLAKSSEGATR